MLREPWTDELDNQIRELWGKKFSKEIGVHIGRTKNSVCGRARRLGLPHVKDMERPTKPKAKRVRRARLREKLPEWPAPPTRVEPLNIPFFELGPSHCRFIVDGHGYRALYCGNPTPEGSSYCSWCSSVVYTRAGPSRSAEFRATQRRHLLSAAIKYRAVDPVA